ITDNADVLRLRDALSLVSARLKTVLADLSALIETHAELACMAYTHLQPAEPTTVGYRLAVYAQDLLEHERALADLVGALRGKGLKGAVGTQASYGEMLAGTGVTPRELEAQVLQAL
ncbi:MAG TPA: lyase family protein, partial [Anaerolineales bacterium]|nr:lyase family protein [Anaerolineales bacterium]